MMLFQRRFFHGSAVLCKNIQFNLADVGEGIREVTVREWLVKVGDRVKEYDFLCNVESDKASTEISTPYAGVVRRLHYDTGAVATVGAPLVELEVDDSVSVAGSGHHGSHSSDSSSASAAPAKGGAAENAPAEAGAALATPAVRRVARELGINLRTVAGTGKGGRILKEDVMSAAEPKPAAAAASAPRTPSAPAAAAATAPRKDVTPLQEDRVLKLTGVRMAMAKAMTQAASVPFFGYCDEIEMSALSELRNEFKAVAAKRGVDRMSYMPVVVKAASLALREFPELNAHLRSLDDGLIVKAAHNIGVAMDTPFGLIVPNIKNVQNLSILEIGREMLRLQDLASRGALTKDDLTGGTFSISNIGAIGGTYARPIAPPPEIVIGALGKIQTLPRFRADGSVFPAKIMQVSWSGDHRVVDGASMARFSNLWKGYLENPRTMLLDLV